MTNSRLQWAALVASLYSFAAGLAHADVAQGVVAPSDVPPGFSAAGSYNLANSYARQGKAGMAVLNYERARLLSANDADIDANLDYVRASAHLPVSAPSRFDRAARIVSPFAAAWIGVIGLLIVGMCALHGQLSSRRRWLRRSVAIVGIAMICLPLVNGLAMWPLLHEGIVISAATPVRVSPVPMGDSMFVLPEAESVKITAEHEGFLLVETSAGRTGWVARTNVASVVPRSN
jgi:hypothetical protein